MSTSNSVRDLTSPTPFAVCVSECAKIRKSHHEKTICSYFFLLHVQRCTRSHSCSRCKIVCKGDASTFLKRSIVSKLSQFLGPAPPTHLRGRGWPAVHINFYWQRLESLDLRQTQCRVLFPVSLASHSAGANCQGAWNPQHLPNHARIRVTFLACAQRRVEAIFSRECANLFERRIADR